MPYVPNSMYLSGIQSCNHAKILSNFVVMCKSVIRSARRKCVSPISPHGTNRITICSLPSLPLLRRFALSTDDTLRCEWFWFFADIPPHLFPRPLVTGRTIHTGQFPFHFYNDKMCMKHMVLGALKEHTYDDSMYKECQKENCYQVFPFLRVSLFLSFFLLS